MCQILVDVQPYFWDADLPVLVVRWLETTKGLGIFPGKKVIQPTTIEMKSATEGRGAPFLSMLSKMDLCFTWMHDYRELLKKNENWQSSCGYWTVLDFGARSYPHLLVAALQN